MSRKLSDFIVWSCIGIALIFMITSCVTEKKRLQICKSCPLKIERKDSIVYKDSIRNVPVIVSHTIAVQTPNPCAELCDENGKLRSGFSRTIPGKKGTSARMFTRNDSVLFEAMADSVDAMAQVVERTIEKYSSTHEQVPARCELEHLSKWDSFFIITGRILWGILILVSIGWYIKKKFF